MPKEPLKDHGAQLIQAAKAYITAHSREKFSLQAVADALYVNKCYLLRQFRARTGGTLLVYHNQVRCEQAKQMLVDTALSISEIGEAVGFVSSSHFAHVCDYCIVGDRNPIAEKYELVTWENGLWVSVRK